MTMSTGGYYFAYLPDFGASSCSATGDSIPAALELLEQVKREVIALYIEADKLIPLVSKAPFEEVK